MGVASIEQIDNYQFTVLWEDGTTGTYRLSDLQQACPCASCAQDTPVVDPKVRAVRVVSVGNYALRIEFTSGCSHGIYSLEELKEMC